MIEPLWLGANKRHQVICGKGHQTSARPSDVNRGTGICRPCSGTDPATVEQAFRAIVAERGGTVVEPVWLGAKRGHRVVCAEGHETTQTPSYVISKGGRCKVCTGIDQSTAWRLFRQLVEERGGEVLEPASLGSNTPHRVRCPEGHETLAIPSSVRVGRGICRACGPTSTIRAERQFREMVAVMGGRITEPVWLGNKTPHRVVCSQGHETTPRPNDVQRTGSICRVCAGHCSETSWQEFKARVAELGGTVIEPEWLGNKKPHRVTCKYGHEVTIRPNNVDQGSGICRKCKCKIWDIFYVVVNDAAQVVKFGVTSHDPRARLRFHWKDGFDRIIRTMPDRPDALDIERAAMVTVQLAGIQPVRGREYYDIAALPVILDIADNWSSTHDRTPRIPAPDEGQAGESQAAAGD